MPTPTEVNLNATNPSAPSGFANINFQAGAPYPDPNNPSVPLRDVSGYLPNLGGRDARTTTTETIGASSRGKIVTLNNASAVAVTLTSTVDASFMCYATNRGAGVATLTPSSGTIDGAANIAITQGQGLALFFDGTNWITDKGVGTGTTASVPLGSGAGGGGPIIAYTKPTLSQFTLGSSTATVADTSSGITVVGSNNTGATYQRSAGLSTPWNIEIGFLGIISGENFGQIVLSLRNGSAGTFIQVGIQHNSTSSPNYPPSLLINRLNADSSFNSQIYVKADFWMPQGYVYMRVKDDGTNRVYYVSADLDIWSQFYTEARTSFSTVDRGGFSIQGSSVYPPCARVIHYKEY